MKNNGTKSNQFELFDELETGEIISQEVLDSIQNEDQELFEILQLSNHLRSAKKVQPDPFYSRVSQIRLYYRIIKDRGSSFNLLDEIKYFFSNLIYRAPSSVSLKPVFTILIALVLSFSLFIGGAQAADDARPGQWLYPVDLAIEEVQLFLTFDDQSRLDLHLSIAEERLAEAETEFSEGSFDNAQVALLGYQKTHRSIQSQLTNQQVEISADFQNTVVEVVNKNSITLTRLLDTAPQAAQTTILQALEASQASIEQVVTVQELEEQPPVVVDEGPNEEMPSTSTTIETQVATPTSLDNRISPNPTQGPTSQPNILQGEPFISMVRVFSVNIHKGPGLDYPVIGWLFKDQTIRSSTCENGFLFIPEFSGWASGTCFEPNPCGPPGSCLQIWD